MRLLSLLLALALCAPAVAQDKRMQEAVRRLQAQNQRLASERADLEREKAKLEQEKDDAQKSRSALERKVKSGARERQDLEDANTALELELADAEDREEALKARLAETEKALAAAREEGAQLRKRLANQGTTIGFWQAKTEACQAKNGELAKLGYDLVERYRQKTCGDITLENEPFTGIARVRMENLLEDYKDQVRAKRFDWRNDSASSGNGASGQ
jgi:chromosome segregation ATPase